MFVCIGPAESDFLLNWTPRVVRPGVQLKMNIKFHTGQHLAALIHVSGFIFSTVTNIRVSLLYRVSGIKRIAHLAFSAQCYISLTITS